MKLYWWIRKLFEPTEWTRLDRFMVTILFILLWFNACVLVIEKAVK